jgi:hypothetical protein
MIEFNQIHDMLFKNLVQYRLVYPKSKLKTTEYLYRYEKKYPENDIYLFLDTFILPKQNYPID